MYKGCSTRGRSLCIVVLLYYFFFRRRCKMAQNLRVERLATEVMRLVKFNRLTISLAVWTVMNKYHLTDLELRRQILSELGKRGASVRANNKRRAQDRPIMDPAEPPAQRPPVANKAPYLPGMEP